MSFYIQHHSVYFTYCLHLRVTIPSVQSISSSSLDMLPYEVHNDTRADVELVTGNTGMLAVCFGGSPFSAGFSISVSPEIKKKANMK